MAAPIEQAALDEQHHDVAQHPPDDQGGAAGRRDHLPVDHARAPFVDDGEADKGAAENAELHQKPGHEHLPGVAGRKAGHAGDPGQQRPEQGEIKDRLQQPDHAPTSGSASEMMHGAFEDDPGVAEKGHARSNPCIVSS